MSRVARSAILAMRRRWALPSRPSLGSGAGQSASQAARGRARGSTPMSRCKSVVPERCSPAITMGRLTSMRSISGWTR